VILDDIAAALPGQHRQKTFGGGIVAEPDRPVLHLAPANGGQLLNPRLGPEPLIEAARIAAQNGRVGPGWGAEDFSDGALGDR